MDHDPPKDALHPEDHAEKVALFRAEIIGGLTRRELSHGELRAELRALKQRRFRPPGRTITRTYSIPTLERWYYAYKAGGLAALRPGMRSDRGHAQEISEDLRDLLCEIRKENPNASANLIMRTLVIDGRMNEGEVSESTVRRLFAERGLDRVSLRHSHTVQTTRLRWQAEEPGALWHGDVCHGPSLVIGGVTRPLCIHALLDDCTRFVVALEAHHAEREIDMLGLLVRALRRHGCPDALYLDNGPTYRGNTLRLACERLGITLLHAAPYDAQARGKMERFWRTLREGLLDFLGSVASLDDVQRRLDAFLDQHYHLAPHASLMGRAPGLVYADGRAGHVDTLTEDKLRDALTVREKRRLRNDSTLSVDGTDWELDQGFLAGHLVVVGRTLITPEAPPWVEHEGKRLALHPVDPIRNARRKRARKEPLSAATTVPFDPAGALLSKRPAPSDDDFDPSEVF